MDPLIERVLDILKMLLSGRLIKEIRQVKLKIKNCMTAEQDQLSDRTGQEMKVSIVIPTLNESKFISNPLKSLQAGQYSNYEVIVVDCMSEDDTVEKARRAGARVLVSSKKNVGYQVHLGFLDVKGDIIIKTDADTIFPRDFLTKTVKAFKNQKTMIYHAGHIYYDGNIIMNLMAHLYDKYWRKPWATTGHFIAVRREAYEKVTFNPLPKSQDYDFGQRAYDTLGPEAFAYNPNSTVLISSRTIKKLGLLRYVLYGGSFRIRERAHACS
ncbi:MAG: glycosyltransferase [Candidatus Bathyarchaeia archaeon]